MLPGTKRQPSLLGFGNFVFDRGSDQLYREGERVHLQGKPLLLLRALLESPGSVVTREDLRQRLWPEELALEFDAGLNTAIKVVRQTLGDTARDSVFVRTERSQGYRFVHPIHYPTAVSLLEREVAADELASVETKSPSNPILAPVLHFQSRRILLAALTLVAGAALLVWGGRRAFRPEAQDLVMEPLTHTPTLPIMTGAISPDGRLLAYADQHHVRVIVISTGASSKIDKFDGLRIRSLAWGGESDTLFVTGFVEGEWLPSLWQGWLVGESPRRRLRDDILEAVPSPDGKQLAWISTSQDQLWAGRIDGSAAHLLYRDPGGELRTISWSPRGNRLWFTRRLPHPNFDIASVGSADGAFRSARQVANLAGLVLLPDGRMLLALRTAYGGELLEFKVDSETGEAYGAPRQRARWPAMEIQQLSTTARGDRVVALQRHLQTEIRVADLAAGNRQIKDARRLTMEDTNVYSHTWTPDSRAVVFESTRHGPWNLFRQDIESDEAQPLEVGTEGMVLARAVPDGGGFLFVRYDRPPDALRPPAGYLLMRASWSGGQPITISHMSTAPDFRCPAAPASGCIMAERSGPSLVFSRLDPVHGPGARMFAVSRGELNPDWDLSPDGRSIAITPGNRADNHMRIFSTAGVERDVAVTGWSGLASVNFWVDGKGFFAASEHSGQVDLISVSLDGRASRLDCDPGQLPAWIVPSPDGRRVALNLHTYSAKAWLLRQF